MTDLIAWMRAQLDDDERVARGTYEASWSVIPQGDGSSLLEGPQVLSATPGVFAEEAEAEHIARWDPARVLAEVDAKRRIIDHASTAFALSAEDPASYTMKGSAAAYRVVLKYLALPYADRPGYREGWRP